MKPTPWAADKLVCHKCNYEWISVHPVQEYVYCPICNNLIPTICDLLEYIENHNSS